LLRRRLPVLTRSDTVHNSLCALEGSPRISNNLWEKAAARDFRAKHFEDSSKRPSRDRDRACHAVERRLPRCWQRDRELLRLVGARYPFRSFGCDYTDKLLSVPGLRIDTVDLNRQPLPYSDNRFALVTCIETIEHLENYREVIREIFHVLQPGGVAVFSTPNILNLRSRLRYVSSGFYNLFGPLAPDESDVHTTRGHINPVSWFYLSHALLSAGFRDLKVTVDKYQRRSLLVFPFLIVPLRATNWIVYHRDKSTYGTLDEGNAWAVRAMNSRDLLLGRTLIVTAAKPA
jgi:SAM-dependent methyltransferase